MARSVSGGSLTHPRVEVQNEEKASQRMAVQFLDFQLLQILLLHIRLQQFLHFRFIQICAEDYVGGEIYSPGRG